MNSKEFFNTVRLMRKAQTAWWATRKTTDYEERRRLEKIVDEEIARTLVAMNGKVEQQELFG